MRRLRSLALPTLSGVLYFVSWIGFGVWPLAFVCFAPLLFSLREATPREALRRGAWFGFVAHLGGVLLLSALQATANGAIADVFFTRRAWPVIGAGLALAASLTYGLWRISRVDAREQGAPSRRIGIAQPNVGEIALHRNPYASVQALWADTAELHARGAEIVVWPEVGYNLRAVRDGDDGRAIQGGIPVTVVAGVERVRGKEAWNSAIVLTPEGKI